MRLQQYYLYYLRNFCISKFNIQNSWEIPKMTNLNINCRLPKDNKDIYFWYTMLITGQKPAFIFKRIRKSRTRKTLHLIFLKTTLNKDQKYKFLEKLLIQIMPYREGLELIISKFAITNAINFSLKDLPTFDETENIYNDPQKIIINDVHFSFSFEFNSRNKYYNECLLRMFQIPIKCLNEKKTY